MTETGMILSQKYFDNQNRRAGFVGFPLPHVKVRIVG
jgi:hypothetical protein